MWSSLILLGPPASCLFWAGWQEEAGRPEEFEEDLSSNRAVLSMGGEGLFQVEKGSQPT